MVVEQPVQYEFIILDLDKEAGTKPRKPERKRQILKAAYERQEQMRKDGVLLIGVPITRDMFEPRKAASKNNRYVIFTQENLLKGLIPSMINEKTHLIHFSGNPKWDLLVRIIEQAPNLSVICFSHFAYIRLGYPMITYCQDRGIDVQEASYNDVVAMIKEPGRKKVR